MDLDEKLEQVEHFDERIERAKRRERDALVKGVVLGVAVVTILGAWSSRVDTPLFDFFRYGCAVVLVGAEYVFRHFQTRRLQARQERLIDRSGTASPW